MSKHEIIIMQQKIYEVISLICYAIKKIRFENNYIISLKIIIISQKIYEVISIICHVIKKIMFKNNNFVSPEIIKVRS